ncbi:hypothetical protein D3C80_2050800 [compost metagenome]
MQTLAEELILRVNIGVFHCGEFNAFPGIEIALFTGDFVQQITGVGEPQLGVCRIAHVVM